VTSRGIERLETPVVEDEQLHGAERALDEGIKARGLTALDTPPKIFGFKNETLIERIGWYLDLDPTWGVRSRPIALRGSPLRCRQSATGDDPMCQALGTVLRHQGFQRLTAPAGAATTGAVLRQR